MHYELSAGSMTTVEGYKGPHVEGQVVYAADSLYIDPSQDHAFVNVKGVISVVSGATIGFNWTGHASLNDNTHRIFEKSPDARTADFGNLTVLVRFEVGDPLLKTLGTTNFVGSGRYLLRNGQMGIEVRISRVDAPVCED